MTKGIWRVLLPMAVAVLPVIIMRDFTPSHELRYLAIADDALESGNLFTFFNNGEPYADKPPLYFWFIMLGKILFGGHKMWFLSLFSLIPAIITILVMDKWTKEVMGEQQRQMATIMLACSGLFTGLSLFLRMDMLMCMFIVLSLYFFWQMFIGKFTIRNRVLFPLSVFFAIFSKGPVGFLMPLAATAAFLATERRFKEFFRYWGWLTWGILALCCALWFGNVWIEGGKEYLSNLLFHQTVDRAVNAFHHKEPLWFYLVSIWWSLAPWSLLLIGGIAVALRKIRIWDTLGRFFFVTALSTLIMLSLSSSKIAVYLMPTFPFIVYLGVMLYPNWNIKWSRIAVGIPAFIAFIAGIGIIVAGCTTDVVPVLKNSFCICAGLLLAAGTGAALLNLWRNKGVYNPIKWVAAAMMIAIFTGAFALPQINTSIGYKELCNIADRMAQESPSGKIYTWNVSRAENMKVHLGYDIEKISTEQLLSRQCEDGIIILKSHKVKGNVKVEEYLSDKECITVGRHIIMIP